MGPFSLNSVPFPLFNALRTAAEANSLPTGSVVTRTAIGKLNYRHFNKPQLPDKVFLIFSPSLKVGCFPAHLPFWGSGLFLKRIFKPNLSPDLIHNFHIGQRMCLRHHRAFQQACTDAAHGFFSFIFKPAAAEWF